MIDFGFVNCDVERFDMLNGGPLTAVNNITTIVGDSFVTPRPAGFCNL